MKILKPAKILIVDDEPFVRDVLSRYLSSEGYDCTQADCGENAWLALQHDDFALLVTDVIMPGISGLELLARTHERFPDIAVILITAVDDRSTAVRALKGGAYGYVMKPFDENEVLISVANALERRRLTRLSLRYEEELMQNVRDKTVEVRRTQEEVILRLVTVSECRDNETGAHIRRLGLYCGALAEAMGWDPDAVDCMRLAAPMHDIGKVGIPDSILLKPGRFTDEEFYVMKRHSEMGAGLLGGSDIAALNMAADIALAHHEKWDGSGYPRGLAGPDIPECARLVAIADVYDALVSARVYRAALSEKNALAIIRDGDGKHFDPTVCACFLSILPQIRAIRKRVGEAM